jgi:hypothetical protein
MPKRERSASTEVAVGELLVVAYIRSAYAGRLNLDLKLAGRRFFDASDFLMIGQTKIRLMYSAPEREISSHLPCGGRLRHAEHLPGLMASRGNRGLMIQVPTPVVRQRKRKEPFFSKNFALVSIVSKAKFVGEKLEEAPHVGVPHIHSLRGGRSMIDNNFEWRLSNGVALSYQL